MLHTSALLMIVVLQLVDSFSNNFIDGLVKLPKVNQHSSHSSIYHSSSRLFDTERNDLIPKSTSEIDRSEAKHRVLAVLSAATVLSHARAASASSATVLRSDEFEVVITESLLGLGLTELAYGNQGSVRVCVQSVKENANESVRKLVKPGMILVAIDGKMIEGKSRAEVI